MIQTIVAVSIGGIGVLIVVLLWFMPSLTRRDLYFAVTVAPEFRDTPEGKSILRRYHTEIIIFSALWLTVFVAGFLWFGIRFIPGGYFLVAVATFTAFYRARKRVLPHAVAPTTIREADLQPHGGVIPGGWMVASGPFIIIGGCAAYLRVRSSSGIYFLKYFLATAGILAAFTLILYGTAHWLRPIHVGGAQGAREFKFRRTVSGMLVAVEYFVALQSSWIALAPRHVRSGPPGAISALFGLFFVVVAVIILTRLGQGGTRAAPANETAASASGAPVGDRTPDRYWRLGVFYFNRDDPAVIVEKRFGIGYTFNFARPASWIFVLLIALGALVPILLTKL